MTPKSELILYQTEDNRTRIEVRLENETVWLTQKLMAELFQKDVRTVNEHIQNIFDEGELSPDSVIRKFRITAADGKVETIKSKPGQYVFLTRPQPNLLPQEKAKHSDLIQMF